MDSTTKLIKELEKQLPLYLYPTPGLHQVLRKQGKNITGDSELKITKVYDSGDAGGIVCAIEDDNQVFIVSLTQLRVRHDHPLSEEILNYQRQRVDYIRRSD